MGPSVLGKNYILSMLKDEEIIHFEYTILEMFSAVVFLPMMSALHKRQTF